MTTWNHDISAAPKDKRVWIVTKCGLVTPTYWVKSREAWAGLGTKEEPIAWQPYVVPVYPAPNPEATIRERTRRPL
ncbi:hypothetical protein J2J97_32320 (plasmid) [Rhizobium bangladeshense]|uniref:hypothetical protein n=1 Tax=Rhizobium bangladeshense TaxID=1138189 RepID=UPI001A986A3D|nr:hypothetical protein [Rhizobium bangladeshense]QSY98591.1 hypothetical protein J2J97_32320 [Rhizobium bangladeshense]